MKIKIILIFLTTVFFALSFALNTLYANEFLVTKSNLINMRIGPGTNYPIKYAYKISNMPFMVLFKFENWYKVQDVEGEIGWVHSNLLKKDNYVMVIKKEGLIHGYKKALESSEITFTSESKVLFKKKVCNKDFCKLKKDNYQGWVKKSMLWGAF